MNEWIVQFQVLLNVHYAKGRQTASLTSQLVKIFRYFEGGDLTDY